MIKCLSEDQLKDFFSLIGSHVMQINDDIYVVKAEAGNVMWILSDSGLFCGIVN